jgi:integrase
LQINSSSNAKDNAVVLTEQGQEDEQISPYTSFQYSIKSQLTLRYYERRIRIFFDFIQFETDVKEIEKRCNDFAQKGHDNISWVLNLIIRFLRFQKERVENKEIAAATLMNFVKALKLFCDSANLRIEWKKLTRGLPKGRQASNDRAPTIEEIRKLVEYPDRRLKAIVYTMVSSGIRIGAWEFLQWKHVEPKSINENGEIIAAKLLVYAGDIEEYYTFVTLEAYNALKEWMDFRASYGEKINGNSWVMRDIWQTTNLNYGAKWGLATNPKKLKSSGIKRLLERALWEQGIREPLKEGERRHEWKAAHGFRKFYQSRTEQMMKPINIQITMGHNIGISESYYKPTERELLDDYLKAADLLTLNGDKAVLQRQVAELKEKTKDNDYVIRAKLEEKDKQIEALTQNQNRLESEVLDILRYAKSKDGKIKGNRTILDKNRRISFACPDENNQLVKVRIPIDSVDIRNDEAESWTKPRTTCLGPFTKAKISKIS